ncbi:toxin [Pseudomonas sp. R1-18]|uniref:RHS repeat-associated core domain-containing protein n=1 Tax=Pseudomonas sp. R1-18 TaxID=1632772 RepID=UPI003DA87DBD
MNGALHAHTPTIKVVDGRGLTVREMAWRKTGELEPAVELTTRRTYDVQGRLVSMLDPRLSALAEQGQPVTPNLVHCYNLAGTPLLSQSVDAGWGLSLQAEAGHVVQSWDTRGSTWRTRYDECLRPVAVLEIDASNDARTISRMVYADGGAVSAEHNRCGRLVRLDDTAGSLHFTDYGVQGHVLDQSRQFLIDQGLPDWTENTDYLDLVEAEAFATRWQYNVLSEPVLQTDARDNAHRFSYSTAGELNGVYLRLNAKNETTLTQSILYNAFGQIEEQTSGNGVISRAVYDPASGLLQSITAGRAGHEILQSLHYGYDPVGNILHIEDTAQPVRFFANQRVEPVSRYSYDTLYQLIEATGREVNTGASHGPALPALQNLPPDPNRVSHYTQTYNYDTGGNLLQMRHVGAHSFTRTLRVAPDSNRSLPEGEVEVEVEVDFDEAFDANGNLLHLVRGQTLDWDPRNQLRQITTVTRDDSASDCERYVYDGQGQRCRKINSAQTSSRTLNNEVRYLPGLEIRTTANGEILHVITAHNARVLHWQAGLPSGIENDQIRYSLNDQLGSSTLELNQLGGLISQESYYPFGGTAWWAARSTADAKYKTIRYSGKERDASGLYYYGFRYYAPWLQRWINPDPAGDVDGLNLFKALDNNPVGRIDLKGNKPVPATAHFFWDGSDIPEPHLQNILIFKELNPEYAINIWTRKPGQILRTLGRLEDSNDPGKRAMAMSHGKSLTIRTPSELFENLSSDYSNAFALEAIFNRESSGPFKNIAAASDILRLAAIYTEGGLYMDTDVAIGRPLGTLEAPHGFLAHIERGAFSNAVIAGIPKAKLTRELLDNIVEHYTTSTYMRFDNENVGWSRKRHAELGLYSRFKLTMNMTGPSMLQSHLRSVKNKDPYSLSFIPFYHRTETTSEFSVTSPRTATQIFMRGYAAGLNGEGKWAKVRPGRRASTT